MSVLKSWWHRWKKTSLPNKLGIVISTFALALTVVNLLLLKKQITDQGGQVAQITGAITDGVKKAKEAIGLTLEHNNIALQKILGENKAALQAAGTQSKATLEGTIRQGQEALSASIEASRLDRRPWIVPGKVRVISEPEEGKPGELTAQCWMSNTGKTPAISVIPFSKPSTSFVEPPAIDISKAVLTHRSYGVIAPAWTESHFSTDPLQLGVEAVATYRSGKASFYIQGRIEYKDSSGDAHWTSFCVYHIFGKPLDEFVFCEQGNDVDHQPRE